MVWEIRLWNAEIKYVCEYCKVTIVKGKCTIVNYIIKKMKYYCKN